MARKILFAQQILSPNQNVPPQDDTTRYDSCFMCYSGCPDYCNDYLPPAPPPPQPSKHEMSITLIIMLVLLGAAFVILSYLTVTRCRRNRNRRDSLETDAAFRQGHDEYAGDHPVWYIRTVGLSQSVIDSITVFRYKKGELLIEGSDCSVCLSEFGEDECLRLLPKCSHAFHVDCIDTWLRSHTNCPVCRAPVVKNGADEANFVDLATTEEDDRVENEARENRIVDSNSEVSDTDDKGDEILSKNGGFLDKRISRGLRVLSDLSNRGVKFDQEHFRQTWRSASVDFGYASVLYVKKGKGPTGRSFTNLESLGKGVNRGTSVYRLTKCSSSSGHSLQRVPVLMKRSFSCSAKCSRRKHSRSLG